MSNHDASKSSMRFSPRQRNPTGPLSGADVGKKRGGPAASKQGWKLLTKMCAGGASSRLLVWLLSWPRLCLSSRRLNTL